MALWPRLGAVPRTSLLTAYWRSVELLQPSPLCVDKPAAALCASLLPPPAAAEFSRSPLFASGQRILSVRTRFLDEWIERPAWPPVRTTKRQIVLLGAGMDTRAYRLGLSMHTTTLFEVDGDIELLNTKHDVLEAAGYRARVPIVRCAADVSDVSALSKVLTEGGLDPTVPTRWVAEGLLEYLAPECHAPLFQLAARLGGARGSGFAAQVLEPSFGDHVESLGVELPYQRLVPVDDVLVDLVSAGWGQIHAFSAPYFESKYSRRPHDGFSIVVASAES
ncbi:hypothetical protein AB1Y20_014137 [Prymnesium parvum]|uniref:S-adenosyl-L-methionine-dependent methyltransferase n=1 Tax=Prymnesium parvum TaxID=97485 RepID=A0AB34IG79_PRYPA